MRAVSFRLGCRRHGTAMLFFINVKTGHLGGSSLPLLFRPYSDLGRHRAFIHLFFLISACLSLKPVASGAGA